jgi:protein TonB
MIGPVLVFALLAQATAASPPQTPAPRPTTSTEQVPPTQPWPPSGVYRIGTVGVVAPEVVGEQKPRYTPEAMSAKIQGLMEVEAIVLADGTVGDVRVVRSLDKEFGLDQQGIAAVKKWQFKPGKKDGAAVPVMVSIELTFSLRSGPGKH